MVKKNKSWYRCKIHDRAERTEGQDQIIVKINICQVTNRCFVWGAFTLNQCNYLTYQCQSIFQKHFLFMSKCCGCVIKTSYWYYSHDYKDLIPYFVEVEGMLV